MSKRIYAVSLSWFVLFLLGCVIGVFTVCISFMLFFFQKSISTLTHKDLEYHVNSSSKILERAIDRYTVIGGLLANDGSVLDFIQDPTSGVNIEHAIVEAKLNFGLEEALILDSNSKIIFQNGKDMSMVSHKEFESLAKYVLERNLTRGFFHDSTIYNAPIFYLLIPVNTQNQKGLLILGKVFSQEFLQTLFPSSSRGVYIFSEKQNGQITVSNREYGIFSDFFTRLEQKDKAVSTLPFESGISSTLETKDFLGLVEARYIRYNTFPIGLVGYYIETGTIKTMQSIFLSSALIGLVISFVIIILGFFVMRRFVITPIEELEKGFRKVADGKLNFHLAQRGIREMQVINSSFNETIDSLQTTYKDLEDRVVQRTSELEKERGSLESKIKERTKELEDLKLQLENLVAQRTQELSKKATELETMNQLMVGRELKMTELKQEIQALKEKLERPKS